MSLKYLFNQPDLNSRQARWLDFLSEYHFELKHIKGKENKVVDALIPRIDCMFQMEGTFGPASSQNIIGNPARGTRDIKR